LLQSKDFEGAMSESNQARMWCWAAFGFAILFAFIMLLFWFYEEL
jgi:hypothetical protein